MQANNVHFLVIIERLFSPRLWISKVHFAVTIETRSQLHSSKVLIPKDLKSENRISTCLVAFQTKSWQALVIWIVERIIC